MKKHNTDLWVNNLEAIYQQALSAKPTKPFFLAIYDYADYVLTTDTLSQISDVFYIQKKSDYETAEQYKKDLIEYIEKLIPKLEKYHTDDPREKDEIHNILSIRKGDTQVMGDPEGWLTIFSDIENIVWNCFRDGIVRKDSLTLVGVEEHNEKKVIRWSAQETYQKYKNELVKMERLRETRGWWAWEHVRLFYEAMNDFEGMQADVVNKQRWFQVMNLSYLKKELEAVLKDAPYDQMQVFIYGNYITYLHKVHRQLINEIAQFEEVSLAVKEEVLDKKPSRFTPFTFDDENTILSINDKKIQFKRDTRKIALLKLLIKKPKGIYYDEAVEELEGAITDEALDTKNIYYEACRGIQISLAKIGITDFLHFDYNQAKINPIYKRTTK